MNHDEEYRKNETIRELLNFFTQSRAESLSIVVALSIGIFSILIIFNEVGKFSIACFALSIVYWVIVFYGIVVYFGVIMNIVAINSLVRKVHEKFDIDLGEMLKNKGIASWVFKNMFSDPNSKRIRKLSGVLLAIMLLCAFILWFTLAFDLKDSTVFNIDYEYLLKKLAEANYTKND